MQEYMQIFRLLGKRNNSIV